MKKKLLIESKTVMTMIRLYCRKTHHVAHLCQQCQDLANYVQSQLEACPYQDAKPNCQYCTIHCYQPDYRKKIKIVMRYAGPRMIWRHPFLTMRHLTRSYIDKKHAKLLLPVKPK